MRRVLQVSTRNWVAGAVWENDGGGWHCVRAAPIIGWLLKCSAIEARDRLELSRYKYEWFYADAVPPD
jgi:hypothetical protein